MFISELSAWVTSAHGRYIFCKKLIDDSKNDPLSDPYRSKYEARALLNLLVSEIENKWKSDGNMQVKLLYALFNYEIGLIALETEEVSAGCDSLNTSWDSIKGVANVPEGCHLSLKVLNQLGILWSGREEREKALEYLSHAESIYHDYKSHHHEICPYNLEDMFMLEKDTEPDWAPFEKTFTYTLYYLAQVYEMAGENDKAASYCRETLKRQYDSGDYEINDWALNCAILSQYYVKKRKLEEARHLLCVATDTAAKREKELDEKETDEEKDVWGEFHKAKACISCCWIKYSIYILEYHDKLKIADLKIDGSIQATEENLEKFRLTNDKNVLNTENEIPVFVSTFEEAKKMFLFAVSHVGEAKLRYTLNQFANNYAQIVRDHSCLYKCLAYYEADLSRQCKMFKRRVDMLEEVLRRLNPQYYLSVCRQLQYELGEIYYEMMDSKLKLLGTTSDHLNNHAIKKINSLIMNGICHFEGFLKSLQDKDGKIPDTFSEDDVRPALIAYFYLGRFYSKLVESDTNRKLHNLLKAEECYKLIVNYVDKNPDHSSYIEVELPVAKEMIKLMPERMVQATGTTLF